MKWAVTYKFVVTHMVVKSCLLLTVLLGIDSLLLVSSHSTVALRLLLDLDFDQVINPP